MLPVGHGNIEPQNSNEVSFTIFSMMLGLFYDSFLIFSIIRVFMNVIEKNKDHSVNVINKNILIIKEFMRRKNINYDLSRRVVNYFEFISKNLKEELMMQANGRFFQEYSTFKDNFSQKMLRSLLPMMKKAHYSPEDVIFSRNEIDDSEIFFIQTGIVKRFMNSDQENENEYLKALTEDEVFGEISFFTGQPRTMSAICHDFTTVVYIKRDDFLSVLQKFPKDYEKYCLIREQIMLENNYNGINKGCYSCKNIDHLIKDCPLLHFHKPPPKIISTIPNSRAPFKRKKMFKSLNSLKKNRLILLKSKQIQIKYFPQPKKKFSEPDPENEEELKSFCKIEGKEELNSFENENYTKNDFELKRSHLPKSQRSESEEMPLIQNNQNCFRENDEEQKQVSKMEISDPPKFRTDCEELTWKKLEPGQAQVFEKQIISPPLKSDDAVIDNFEKIQRFEFYHPEFNFENRNLKQKPRKK